jgi:hypothetical protein
MKFRTLVLTLLTVVFISSLFAAEEKAPPKQLQTIGANSYGAETLESLTTVGLVKLNRTLITHELNVNGSLIAQGATIGSVEVIGEANLTDTIIQNGGTILGYLQTHHATVNMPLIINGQKASLTSSKLVGITVRTMDAFKGTQIIELRQKTIVDGPITFESGKGEVHLYSGSQVLGPVSGGKVIKKN